VFCVGRHLAVSHKYNSNSLAAVLHINKSNAAGNSKRLYTPDINEHVQKVSYLNSIEIPSFSKKMLVHVVSCLYGAFIEKMTSQNIPYFCKKICFEIAC